MDHLYSLRAVWPAPEPSIVLGALVLLALLANELAGRRTAIS